MPSVAIPQEPKLLRNIHFKRLIRAKFFASMAGRMVFTIISWEIYEITGDPLAIGLLGLFEVVPAVATALFAGNIIDKYNRKVIAQVASLGNLTIMLSLLASTSLLEEHGLVYAFYTFAFCVGLVRSFWSATLNSMLPNIIGKKAIPKAAPWNTGSWLVASIIGHATGGFLIAYSPLVASAAVAVSLIAYVVFQTSRLPSQKVSKQHLPNTWLSIKKGITYVWKTQVILSALSLDLFAVLFGGVVALLPIYAKDILLISPTAFGWLNAAMDIGAGLGTLIMGMYPLRRKQGQKMIIAAALFGLFIILFALSTNFWISFFALLLCGMIDAVSMIVRGIILQSRVPDNIRGRVMSVNSIFVASSNELGQFESGIASKLIGVVPAAVSGGCITIFVSMLVYLRAKKLRKLEWDV